MSVIDDATTYNIVTLATYLLVNSSLFATSTSFTIALCDIARSLPLIKMGLLCSKLMHSTVDRRPSCSLLLSNLQSMSEEL